MRSIILTALNKKISLGNYIQAIKKAKSNLDVEFKYGLTCWWPCTGREIVRQFRESIMDRINQKISYSKRGTKE